MFLLFYAQEDNLLCASEYFCGIIVSTMCHANSSFFILFMEKMFFFSSDNCLLRFTKIQIYFFESKCFYSRIRIQTI